MQERINLPKINSMIEKKMVESHSGLSKPIINFLMLIRSKLYSIPNECTPSLLAGKNKDAIKPDYIKEFKDFLNDIPNKYNDIIGLIKVQIPSCNKEEKEFLTAIVKILEDLITMIEKRKDKIIDERGNRCTNFFSPMYERCTENGGVYFITSQSADPFIGHIKEKTELKECPGICGGLVYVWTQKCIQEGKIKEPVVGNDAVHNLHEGSLWKSLLAQTEKKEVYTIGDDKEIIKMLKSLTTKPVYVIIKKKELNDGGHAWGLRRLHNNSYEFFDPNSGYFHLPNLDSFISFFMSYVVFHQAPKVFKWGVNQLEFYHMKHDCKPLVDYFPSMNEYAQSSTSMSLEQRSRKLLLSLLKNLKMVEKVITDNDYKSDERISIIKTAIESYVLSSINAKDDLEILISILQLFLEDSQKLSSLQEWYADYFKDLMAFVKSKDEFQQVFRDLKTQYVEKLKNPNPKLGIDEFIGKYKNMERKLERDINNIVDDGIKKKNAASLALAQILTNKLIRLKNLKLVDKLLVSTDKFINFGYSLDHAKIELGSVIPNYEDIFATGFNKTPTTNLNNIEDVSDALIVLLDWAGSYVESQIHGLDHQVGLYRQEQHLLRVLIAIGKAKNSIDLLSKSKNFTLDQLKAIFTTTPEATNAYEEIMSNITDPKQFIRKIEEKGHDINFINRLLNVRVVNLNKNEIKILEQICSPAVIRNNNNNQITPFIKDGLIELKRIIYIYLSAENNNDISKDGLKDLMRSVFGIEILKGNVSMENLLNGLLVYQNKLLHLCDAYNEKKLDRSKLVNHPQLDNCIDSTFEDIKNMLIDTNTNNYQGMIIALNKSAPCLTDDLNEDKINNQTCYYYFNLSSENKNKIIADITTAKKTIVECLDGNILKEMKKKYKLIGGDEIINPFLTDIKKTIEETCKESITKIGATGTIKTTSDCLANFREKLSLNLGINADLLFPDPTNAIKIDPVYMEKVLCNTLVQFGKKQLDSTDLFTNKLTSLKENLNKALGAVKAAVDQYCHEKVTEQYNNVVLKINEIYENATKKLSDCDKSRESVNEVLQTYYNDLSCFLKAIVNEEADVINDDLQLAADYPKKLENYFYDLIDKTQLQPLGSNPDTMLNAQHTLKKIITYFANCKWEVNEFSLRIGIITISKDQEKKIVPHHAALIFSLYRKAQESKITWENALYQIEGILAKNFNPGVSNDTFWGRKKSTQIAYNTAFRMIQENFHAKFFNPNFIDVLNKFKPRKLADGHKDKQVAENIKIIVGNAIEVLLDNDKKYRVYEVIQELISGLYKEANSLPWFGRKTNECYIQIMNLIAQLNGCKDSLKDKETIKKVIRYMDKEDVFFKARSRQAEQSGLKKAMNKNP